GVAGAPSPLAAYPPKAGGRASIRSPARHSRAAPGIAVPPPLDPSPSRAPALARLARSGRVGQGCRRPMRLLRKALRYLLFLGLALLVLLAGLIVLWRFVPPVSTLMLGRWVTFRGVERSYVPVP